MSSVPGPPHKTAGKPAIQTADKRNGGGVRKKGNHCGYGNAYGLPIIRILDYPRDHGPGCFIMSSTVPACSITTGM
jgi:hypothetical protein